MYDWVASNVHSQLPSNAVRCSTDLDGSDVYLGRTHHGNTILLVKIIPRKSVAYFAYNGKEHRCTHYEVLVNHLRESQSWVSYSHGQVPLNAVQCGFNKEGKKLFVGRARHGKLDVPGYVHPHMQCIYYPYDGKEKSAILYEVLVHNC